MGSDTKPEFSPGSFFGYESWADPTGEFIESAGQIVEGSILAANQVNFRLVVQNILGQLEAGKTTITRPSSIEDNAVGFPDLTKFLDYFFGDKDTTSVDNFFKDSAFFNTSLNVVQETGLSKEFETAFTERLQNNIDTYFEKNPLEEGQAGEPNLDEIFTDGYVISGDTLYETAPNGRTIVDTYELGEDGNWVSTTTGFPAGQSEVAAKEEFPEEASAGDIFYNEAGDGFIFKDGMWGVATQEDLTYKLPENEAVDVTELTEEQQTDIWGKIKEGLGKIPGAIGKVIFGPDGMPTNVDEWIEWVDETLQAQMGPENLPFPIVITTNPTEGNMDRP